MQDDALKRVRFLFGRLVAIEAVETEVETLGGGAGDIAQIQTAVFAVERNRERAARKRTGATRPLVGSISALATLARDFPI